VTEWTPPLRWTLAAALVALAAAAPFTHIGRLHASQGRFWLALAAAAVAPGALALAVWATDRFAVAVAPCVVVAGVALALFAWSANPPQRHAAPPDPVPAQLDVASAADGDGVQISNADVAKLLATHGIPQQDVESYVLSFYGPIDAETLQPGMTFLRYGAQATGAGRFLTKKTFTDSRTAQLALHLSWFNTAVCKAPVKVLKRTLVLVGAIAFGEPGVKQYVILEPDAFSFGTGSAYSSAACG
jgi:hypothetical protein